MKKAVILGCSGSGKSTFAIQLHSVTQLPLYHLDNVWWNPDRTHISRDEFDKKLDELIHLESWILDGDFSRTYEKRIAACDTIFFLDYGEKVCMNGIKGRVGKDRGDIPWTENKLDPELVKLVKDYETENKPVLFELFKKYPDKDVITFQTREEADRWIKDMSIRTNYEKWYAADDYYWGLEPGSFLEELIKLCPPKPGKKVLDIGCGEGKDAVYMAQKGYAVSAFDLTENGIRKTINLAESRKVSINAYVDDINTFDTQEKYDIVYSTGTVQYLFEQNKKEFFDKINRITKTNGVVFFNVFVEKPFLELPPDWDLEEKMWKPGELFTFFPDWKVERIEEEIFEDHSGGVPHFHCMDTIICRKMDNYSHEEIG